MRYGAGMTDHGSSGCPVFRGELGDEATADVVALHSHHVETGDLDEGGKTGEGTARGGGVESFCRGVAIEHIMAWIEGCQSSSERFASQEGTGKHAIAGWSKPNAMLMLPPVLRVPEMVPTIQAAVDLVVSSSSSMSLESDERDKNDAGPRVLPSPPPPRPTTMILVNQTHARTTSGLPWGNDGEDVVISGRHTSIHIRPASLPRCGRRGHPRQSSAAARNRPEAPPAASSMWQDYWRAYCVVDEIPLAHTENAVDQDRVFLRSVRVRNGAQVTITGMTVARPACTMVGKDAVSVEGYMHCMEVCGGKTEQGRWGRTTGEEDEGIRAEKEGRGRGKGVRVTGTETGDSENSRCVNTVMSPSASLLPPWTMSEPSTTLLVLRECIIRDAGRHGLCITGHHARVVAEDSAIRSSQCAGIYIDARHGGERSEASSSLSSLSLGASECRVRLTRCLVTGSAETGVEVVGGGAATVEDSVIGDNGACGVRVHGLGSTMAMLRSHASMSRDFNGINVQAGGRAEVEDSVVCGNRSSGVIVAGLGSVATLTRTDVFDSQESNGVRVVKGGRAVLQDCRVYGNGGALGAEYADDGFDTVADVYVRGPASDVWCVNVDGLPWWDSTREEGKDVGDSGTLGGGGAGDDDDNRGETEKGGGRSQRAAPIIVKEKEGRCHLMPAAFETESDQLPPSTWGGGCNEGGVEGEEDVAAINFNIPLKKPAFRVRARDPSEGDGVGGGEEDGKETWTHSIYDSG